MAETLKGREPRSYRWILGGVAAAVVLLLAIVVGASIGDHGAGQDASRVHRFRQSCVAWADAYGGSDSPSPGWCTAMTDWMGARMGQRSTMWRSPRVVQRSCERWMAADPDTARPSVDAAGWCRQMVAWMDRHMGDWDGWMGGPMMGGP
jgi:hypothetical protein